MALPIAPISKIIGVLKDQNTYEVFLEADNRVGLITIRDILRASNITTAKAESLAYFVPKLSPRTTIEEAARLMMEYRIRALPVIEDNTLIGSIQALSIIQLMRERGFSKTRVRNIMTQNPITITSDSLVSKARRLMIRRRIDHLPVLMRNELNGVLTSNQIVVNMLQATETISRDELLSEQRRKLEFPVKHLMNPNPSSCEINDDLARVFDEMVREGTTCSIATLWNEVQGIITYRDYMKLITAELEMTRVPIYIVGLPDEPFEAEMTKTKFTRDIKRLQKSFPFIEEAKAVIKTFDEGNKERRRYEVDVSIITPKRTFSYSEKGWELPKVFDEISNKLKKTLSRRSLRRTSRRR